MTIWIDIDLCNGCKRCLKECPYDAIEMKGDKAYILDRCTSCGACLSSCKQQAIGTDAEPKVIPDFSDRQGVWVFAEQKEGKLNPVSIELLGIARALADELGQDVSALLLGDQVSDMSEVLIQHGANSVYLAEHKTLKDYRTIAYTKVIEDLVMSHKPGILLMGATHNGRDLAPRVARRVGSGLTADCTELSIDPEDGVLLQTRPAFGGNVMATIANRYSRPQMATVRPGIMEALKKSDRKGGVIKHEVSLLEKEIGTEILGTVTEKKKSVDITKARVLVAGGRGVGNEEGFKVLKDLAAVMNMKVIAEGVESVSQATILKNLGCTYAQGFYFARPLEPRAATLLLERKFGERAVSAG